MAGEQPPSAPVSATERALFGAAAGHLHGFLDGWARAGLGCGIGRVRFRAGRIDVVWGVDLTDGRPVVLKVHRPPVDLAAVRLTREVQRVLAAAGFPCAVPLAGPDEVDGHFLTAETLIEGGPPDGRAPAGRLLLAEGLARHIDLLRGRPDLVGRVGQGPSWCRYQTGPWPVPHDPLVELGPAPAGYAWLDGFGRRAADQVLAFRDPGRPVAGHADWYAGNTAVADGSLVGTFDWDLVADDEAVIAGFAAACYASSATAGGGLSSPEEAALFLADYDRVRTGPFSARQRRAAAGAAAWIIAFNARWHVDLIRHGLCDEATVALAGDRGEEFLALEW